MAVRPECDADEAAVRAVVTAAFGRASEAVLVDALRRRGDTLVSLVAVDAPRKSDASHAEESDGTATGAGSGAGAGGGDGDARTPGSSIVGHIAFSRCSVGDAPAALLAPASVHPDHQRRGIGSTLVKAGLAALAAAGETLVLVLGHPEYYPRFGFKSETAAHIKAPWPNGDAFMALKLDGAPAGDVTGELVISAAFDELPDDEHAETAETPAAGTAGDASELAGAGGAGGAGADTGASQ